MRQKHNDAMAMAVSARRVQRNVTTFRCTLVTTLTLQCSRAEETFQMLYSPCFTLPMVVAGLHLLVPSTSEVLFNESFDSDPFTSGRWLKNNASKYSNQPVQYMPVRSSQGEDFGLQLTQDMKHYAFASKFLQPLMIENSDLVIQYDVKFIEGLSCGGAYIKLIRDDIDLSEIDSTTPYAIMFGPDKCGGNDKVHFILLHRGNEKHAKGVPTIKADKDSHLYTLAVKNDNSFEIFIDQQSEYRGSLLNDMDPPINPPAEIDDPTDRIPDSWDSREKIPDPHAEKPVDWDESEPATILDLNAVIPMDWLVDEPVKIPDPAAEKPIDWDDEEDGEYEAPMIANPKCADVSGCGAWNRPHIKNPLYKGLWKAPMIDNPGYQGQWVPRKIPNPDYFLDNKPSDIGMITGVAVEVWTTDAGIHFDNFFISTSLEEAFASADETFGSKSRAEKEAHEKELMEQKAKWRDVFGEDGWWSSFQDIVLKFAKYLVEMDDVFAISVVVANVIGVVGLVIMLNRRPAELSTLNSGNEEKGGDFAEERENENRPKASTEGIRAIRRESVAIEQENEEEETPSPAAVDRVRRRSLCDK